MSEMITTRTWLSLIKNNLKARLLKHEPLYERFARTLETTNSKQIRDRFSDEEGGYCAAGLLMKHHLYDPVVWSV
jgi:hypothetical protein